MIKFKFVGQSDKEFWFSLDKHISETEFERKVRDKMGYVLLEDENPVGILRYNLFWDNTPFLNLIFIDWPYQKKGYGCKLINFWESEMKSLGFGIVMTSTQADEQAQHFYRKLGYKDCGCLVLNTPKYEQPMEMFLVKEM
ncbi:MAG: GNAT family N-acetyltransferase [Eubacteriales bacterium]|nr:GNAT family N-acetyltransferase [Eubacteriales bacterium]MDD4475648.1 GNAT family N-acetyltransferase [Eubacteriales bacterium]